MGKDPSHLRDLAAEAREDAAAVAKLLTMPADPPTALKGELGVARRVAWSRPIPLDDVKAIGHATGTTVNDVLLTAVTGALRRYLDGRDTHVDEIPRWSLSTCGRSISRCRPTSATASASSTWRCPWESRTAEPPRPGPQPHGADQALPRGRRLLRGARRDRPDAGPDREAVVDLFSTKGSAVMTNVPGPRQPVYMAGTPVRGVLVWAPTSGGVSMSVAIFSYAGEVTMGVMTDAGLVPDPEKIIEAFEPELDSLEREAA